MLNDALVRKENYLQNLYEDLKNNILTNEEYFILKKKYNNDVCIINERINSIKLESDNETTPVLDKISVIINNFVYRIEVGSLDKSLQEINIIWDLR